MRTHAILSALGRDRIGVADDLAATLATKSVDIESSRMTALGGRFAIIARVSGADDDVTRLQRELSTLAAGMGIELRLEPVGAGRTSEKSPRYVIESYSTGPSGIGALTGVLKRHHVNIENLRTDAASIPFCSEATFHMRAHITLPPNCAVDALREELRVVERVRKLDIIIRPTHSADATVLV